MSGKYGSSAFAVFLVGGYNLLAAKLQGVTYGIEVEQQPSHGMGDSWRETSPTGMRKADLSQDDAFFDDSTAGIHAAMSSPTANATTRVACLAHAENTIGQPFMGFYGAITVAYKVLAKLGLLTNANVTYAIAGALDDGVILQNWTQKTIDWNTKTDGDSVDYTLDPRQRVTPITSNSQAGPTVITTPIPHGLVTGELVVVAGVTGSSPSIDGQRAVTVLSTTTFSVAVDTSAGTGGTGGTFVRANSPNGGVGYQEVSELTGLTGFVGIIQHSTDDVTFSTLLTFANVTAAPAAERVTVTGTVHRFLAYDGNVTGAGTLTPFVGFARNDAVVT